MWFVQHQGTWLLKELPSLFHSVQSVSTWGRSHSASQNQSWKFWTLTRQRLPTRCHRTKELTQHNPALARKGSIERLSLQTSNTTLRCCLRFWKYFTRFPPLLRHTRCGRIFHGTDLWRPKWMTARFGLDSQFYLIVWRGCVKLYMFWLTLCWGPWLTERQATKNSGQKTNGQHWKISDFLFLRPTLLSASLSSFHPFASCVRCIIIILDCNKMNMQLCISTHGHDSEWVAFKSR